MSERAQVELDYSARIEALGRKYSNSITAEAQNPLLSHPTAHATAAAHAAASAKVEDKSGHSGKSAVAAKTPAKAGPTNTSAAPVTPVVPIATTATSAMSRSFHTITSLTGVLSASKAAVTPLTGTGTGAGAGTVQTGGTPGAAAEDDPSPELDSSSHGRHLIHAGTILSAIVQKAQFVRPQSELYLLYVRLNRPSMWLLPLCPMLLLLLLQRPTVT